MKTILFYSLIAITITSSLFAQPYGNEWIDYSKTYYKIKVAQTGFYHISYNDLSNAGLNTLPSNGFKIFHKGQEIPLHASTDGILNDNDYLSFYGQKNDGELDTKLFDNPDWQLHDYLSLFSDTINYFLVWDTNTPAQRFIQTTNDISGSPTPDNYFMRTSRIVHRNQHYPGRPFRLSDANNYTPDFNENEGFVSSTFGASISFNTNINTPNLYTGPDALPATFKAKIVGRSDNLDVEDGDHYVQISIGGNPYGLTIYDGYDNAILNEEVNPNHIGANTTQVTYATISGLSNDWNGSAYTQITYPASFDFNGYKYFEFELADNNERYLEIANFDEGASPVLYDLSNQLFLHPVFADGLYKIKLPAAVATGKRKLALVSSTTCILGNCTYPCIADQCGLWEGLTLMPTIFTDYSLAANQGDYLLVTHPSLRTGTTDWLNEYALYRNSAQGGTHQSVVVNIDQLYDQFAWGTPKHPIAIRNFVNYSIDTWSNTPKFLCLAGKSVSYEFPPTYSPAYNTNLVPTYGHTPSDNMLGVRGTNGHLPQLAIGRVSARSNNDIKIYLQKLIEYERERECTREDRLWTKHAAHLANGHEAIETAQYVLHLEGYKSKFESVNYGGKVVGSYDYTGYPDAPSNAAFTQNMNDGLAVLAFVGHSTETNINFDFREPEDYNNIAQYPFIFAGSCFVGDIHNYSFGDEVSQAERYTLADERGGIGFLATVQFGMSYYLDLFCTDLYKQFVQTNYGATIGDCILAAYENNYIDNPNHPLYLGLKTTLQEYTLEGDPAVILAGSYEKPELHIEMSNNYSDVQIIDPATDEVVMGNPLNIPFSPMLQFDITVTNLGKAIVDNFIIRIEQQFPDGTVTLVNEMGFQIPAYQETYSINANIEPNSNTTDELGYFIVSIDTGLTVDEDCENNNQVSLPVILQSFACASLTNPVIDETLSNTYCLNDNAVALTAVPEGGTFGGNGINDSTFNPNEAGTGSHIITYNYTDEDSGCELADTRVFLVNEAIPATFTVANTSVCVNDFINIGADIFNGIANYIWDFDGGSAFDVDVYEQYNVSWNNPGIKTVSLQTVKNGCWSTIETISIEVIEPITAPTVNCISNNPNSVMFEWSSVTEAIGYQIYADGSLLDIVYPETTTYTIPDVPMGNTYNINIVAISDGLCGNSGLSSTLNCSTEICATIVPSIDNINESYCINDAAITLIGSPNTGTFMLDGVTTDTFNPASLGAGTYNLSYTVNSEGCVFDSNIYTVTVYEEPNPIIENQALLCPNASVTLSLDQSYDAYAWSDDNNTATITVNEAGTYSVTVTKNGCTNTASLEVVAANEPEFNLLSNEAILCYDASIELSTNVPFEDYLWSNEDITPTTSINEAGVYSLTVTDTNGCQWEQSITINLTSLVIPQFVWNDAPTPDNGILCEGETAVLSVDNAYESYLWSNEATTTNITVNEAGTYAVTVTNTEGCQAIITDFNVSTQAAPLLESINPPNAICAYEGNSFDLSDLNPSEVNGLAGDYTWFDNSDLLNPLSTTIVTEPGNYYVVFTTTDACSNMTDVAIDFIALPDAPEISANLVLCNEGINPITPLPDPAALFIWYNEANEIIDTAHSFLPEQSGNFSAQQLLNGCTSEASDFAVVMVPALNSLTVNNSYVYCGDQIFESITPIGVYPGADVLWYTESFNDTLATTTFTPTNEGTYHVSQIINGCESVIETVTVTQIEASDLNVSIVEIADDDPCYNGFSVYIDPNNAPLPPYQFSIDGDNYSYNETFPNLTTGTYTVYVYHPESGCLKTLDYTINEGVLDATINCDYSGSTVTAMATVTGGTPPYSYEWDSGETSESIAVATGFNELSVRVTDANGCIIQVYNTVPCTEVGLNDTTIEPSILVHPNPNNGLFLIQVNGNNTPVTIDLYNVLGEKVSETTTISNNSPYQIDLSTQVKGIYLLSCKINETYLIKKIIVH